MFNACGDIHPSHDYNTYPETKTIFANNCDKNFVYYWMYKSHIFPKVENLYLNSHPCESVMFSRWSDINVYLIEHYRYMFGFDWAKESSRIKIIKQKDYQALLASYEVDNYDNDNVVNN